MSETISSGIHPPEHYTKPLERELGTEGLYDPQEEALKALIEGAAAIDDFIESDEAAVLAKFLSENVDEMDTIGTPLFTDNVEDLPDGFAILRGEEATILRRAIDMYVHLVCVAADIDPLTIPRPEAEAIRYKGNSGMPWHTDNYEPNDSFPAESQHIGVLNGVLTLSGMTNYYYKDPETGEVFAFKVKPGTLVVSRSGDLDGLEQVEHMVDAPEEGANGERERIALLISLHGIVLPS